MQPWATIYAIRYTQYAIRFTKLLLYNCRGLSTNQLLFMQNKPNFKYAQINVNSYMKSKYEKLDTWLSGKNKANSNPIKPNLVRRRRIPKAKIACQKIWSNFLVVGAYAMGAYSQIISVYNLIIFPFDPKIRKWFIFGQLYWFCSMLPG